MLTQDNRKEWLDGWRVGVREVDSIAYGAVVRARGAFSVDSMQADCRETLHKWVKDHTPMPAGMSPCWQHWHEGYFAALASAVEA